MTTMTVMTMILQRFSKGVAALFLEMRYALSAMGGNIGSASATKSVAVAVPLGL